MSFFDCECCVCKQVGPKRAPCSECRQLVCDGCWKNRGCCKKKSAEAARKFPLSLESGNREYDCLEDPEFRPCRSSLCNRIDLHREHPVQAGRRRPPGSPRREVNRLTCAVCRRIPTTGCDCSPCSECSRVVCDSCWESQHCCWKTRADAVRRES